MLSVEQRKQALEVWQGASDFHRAWIADLTAAADHGHAPSETALKIFLRHRRATERTSVAYAKTMDEIAQLKLDFERLKRDAGAALGVDDQDGTEGGAHA